MKKDMQTVFKILFIPVSILALIFLLRFIIGGPEDSWICENEQWIKHGNPTAEMPSEECK